MRFTPVAAALALSLLWSSTLAGQGGKTSDRSVAPILQEAMPFVERIEQENFEIVRMEFDIVSGQKSTFRQLHDGWTYGVLAFGDFRIEDIDLVLYESVNGEWVEVDRDEGSERSANVIVEPSKPGMYKIEVIAYRFAEGYSVGRYGLIVFHE